MFNPIQLVPFVACLRFVPISNYSKIFLKFIILGLIFFIIIRRLYFNRVVITKIIELA